MNLARKAPSRPLTRSCVPGHSPRPLPGGPPEGEIDDEHERRGASRIRGQTRLKRGNWLDEVAQAPHGRQARPLGSRAEGPPRAYPAPGGARGGGP